jgi:hypothetical protein
MSVLLFRSVTDPGLYGLTADASGSNLPDEHAPRRQLDKAILDDGGILAAFAASDAVRAVVELKGFCLSRPFPAAPLWGTEG